MFIEIVTEDRKKGNEVTKQKKTDNQRGVKEKIAKAKIRKKDGKNEGARDRLRERWGNQTKQARKAEKQRDDRQRERDKGERLSI